MARDRANIRTDIWGDDDWRNLTAPAQYLYFLLLTHPTLTYCGVADWRPGRLAALAKGCTAEDIVAMAAELEEAQFIVVDTDTEEVLVRSFVKHDGLLKQPRMAVSMATAFAATASEKLRNVIAFEVQKYHSAHPDLKGWDDPRVQTVLSAEAKPSSELRPTFTPGFTHRFTPGFTPNQALGLGLPTTTATATTTFPRGNSAKPDGSDNPPSKDVVRLCDLLAELIRNNGNRVGTVGKRWHDACDRLIRIDGHSPDEIEDVIRWSQQDEFWIPNILSMPKLREKFDTLRGQMRSQRKKPQQPFDLYNATAGVVPAWQRPVEATNG